MLPFSPTCSFINAYEAYFIQELLKKDEKKLAQFFNYEFPYIDGFRSLSNSKLGDFIDRIYPIELEIKKTTLAASFYKGNHDMNHKLWNI
jgi:hypothetical protein